jgi:hypothetical protein
VTTNNWAKMMLPPSLPLLDLQATEWRLSSLYLSCMHSPHLLLSLLYWTLHSYTVLPSSLNFPPRYATSLHFPSSCTSPLLALPPPFCFPPYLYCLNAVLTPPSAPLCAFSSVLTMGGDMKTSNRYSHCPFRQPATFIWVPGLWYLGPCKKYI